MVVPLQSAVALLLALLVNVKMRGTNFFRTIYFLPVVTSIVVVSMLVAVHVPAGWADQQHAPALASTWHPGTDWLDNPTAAMPAIIVLSIWQACGIHMVIWLSGLQTIPGELYEAADLDGATSCSSSCTSPGPGCRRPAPSF